jgi:hypothetical protein
MRSAAPTVDPATISTDSVPARTTTQGSSWGPQRPPLRQLACLIAWSISRRRIGHGAVVMPGVRVLGATRLLAGDEEVLTFDELPVIRMCAY